jgi:hypothetical protein
MARSSDLSMVVFNNIVEVFDLMSTARLALISSIAAFLAPLLSIVIFSGVPLAAVA